MLHITGWLFWYLGDKHAINAVEDTVVRDLISANVSNGASFIFKKIYPHNCSSLTDYTLAAFDLE